MRHLSRHLALSVLVALSLGAVSSARAETIRGKILRIQPDALALNLQVGDRNVPVQATRDTAVTINGRQAAFADLRVGDLASIDGAPNDRGVFMARSIHAHRDTDGDQQIAGVVQDVSPDRRLLSLRTRRGVVSVHAVEDARIVIDGEPARFGQIQPRDHARVVGRLDDHHVFQARGIIIRRHGNGEGHDRDFGQWARGQVQRIDLENLRFGLQLHRGLLVVQATPDTRVLDANGQPIRFDQIQTGERAEVIGYLLPARDDDRRGDHRVLLALRIHLRQ